MVKALGFDRGAAIRWEEHILWNRSHSVVVGVDVASCEDLKMSGRRVLVCCVSEGQHCHAHFVFASRQGAALALWRSCRVGGGLRFAASASHGNCAGWFGPRGGVMSISFVGIHGHLVRADNINDVSPVPSLEKDCHKERLDHFIAVRIVCTRGRVAGMSTRDVQPAGNTERS